MTAMYLEHYLDSLESLPVELSRNFSLMRDLDLQAQDILSQIDDSTDEYMRTSKDLTPMEKTKKVGDISKQFTRCKEYGDDKVSLAMQVFCSGGMNAPNYAMGFLDTHSRGINLQSLFPNAFIFRRTIWWTSTSASWTQI